MKRKKILDQIYIKNKFPINIRDKDKNLFIYEIKRKINKAYIYFLENQTINGDGTPNIFNYRIIKDFLKFNSLSKKVFLKKIILTLIYLMKNSKFFKKYKIIDKGIFVHDRHSENYFHWITDVIPKILWAKKKGLLKNYKLIFPEFNNQFQCQSILPFKKSIFELNKFLYYKVNKLIYLTEFHPSGFPRKKYLLETQKFFKKKFNIRNKSNQKIYISRAQASRRRLLNEKELIDFLKKKNFKIIQMEDLDFKKQISLCSSSKVLISVHGAGLTNIIWMKKNTKLIEIRDSQDITLNPYFAISQQLGIKYFYYLSEPNNIINTSSHRDYIININKFAQNFEKVIN